jgi:hypothetical protein
VVRGSPATCFVSSTFVQQRLGVVRNSPSDKVRTRVSLLVGRDVGREHGAAAVVEKRGEKSRKCRRGFPKTCASDPRRIRIG